MTSISTYSFISFINGLNINASLDEDSFVAIPDIIRSGLNVYWNKGRFIGAGIPANEASYNQVSLSTVHSVDSTSRIEKITFSANPSSPRWTNDFTTPSPRTPIGEQVEDIQTQLEQEASQGNLVTGSSENQYSGPGLGIGGF
jgi:hypothetical protein|tara:strand:+ start:4839 stop:5267 length:429 start_codon:yes stop_codon:yes gene_type:complete